MKKIVLLLAMICLPAIANNVGYTADGTGFMPTDSLEFGKIQDLQTTDATETVAHTKTMPDPATWMVDVTCEARKTDGTKREAFKKSVLIYRSGGAAAIAGSIVNNFSQPGVTYSMTFGVSSNDFQVKVTGAASETVDWRCAFSKLKLE